MTIKNNLLLIEDGIKLFFRSKRKQLFKTKKYKGKSTKICKEIIKDCYDEEKKYYRVSPNNFNQFYARDFGMICEALINLGYKEEVINTIKYAMSIYAKKGRCTTQINTRGKPLDFPVPSPESESYMLNAIIHTKDKKLIEQYKPFFEKQAKRIYNEDIDKKTGLLKKNKKFSSMKDFAKQQSACYTNSMLGLFANNLKKIGIRSELQKYNYNNLILTHFWRGTHFVDDLSGKEIISGDANVFPFWTKLVEDKKIFKQSLKTIKQRKLDEPFALKYNNVEDKMEWHLINIINKNYEHGTIWLHLAVCYFKVLDIFKEKKELTEQLQKHKELIEKQGTFYEVYTPKGKPYRSLVFEHDEAMIWCAGYLEQEIKTKKQKNKFI
jgi:Holliday junction resolvasome RuvABC DNA-binding subunit